MPIFAVTYTYTDDDALRDAHRPAHRAHLAALLADGTLAASGPWGARAGSPAGALLVVRAADEQEALTVLDADPFLTAGAIASRDAREWVQVNGPWASGS